MHQPNKKISHRHLFIQSLLASIDILYVVPWWYGSNIFWENRKNKNDQRRNTHARRDWLRGMRWVRFREGGLHTVRPGEKNTWYIYTVETKVYFIRSTYVVQNPLHIYLSISAKLVDRDKIKQSIGYNLCIIHIFNFCWYFVFLAGGILYVCIFFSIGKIWSVKRLASSFILTSPAAPYTGHPYGLLSLVRWT